MIFLKWLRAHFFTRQQLIERFWWFDVVIGVCELAYAGMLAWYTQYDLQHAIQFAFFGFAAILGVRALYRIFSNPIEQRVKEDQLVAKREANAESGS